MLGHNGACEGYGLGRGKDINQINSQINMITSCAKYYEGSIPRGMRASERATGESCPEKSRGS